MGNLTGALPVHAQFSEFQTGLMPRTTREQRFEERLGGSFGDGGDFDLVEAGVPFTGPVQLWLGSTGCRAFRRCG